MERDMVRMYIYPSLLQPPPELYFHDQFASRPTGSTTAALIAMLQTISDMLTDYPYVHVFALDFSKAFDTVRHSTLLEKLAKLDLPDEVYNWMKDFFDGHSHFTQFVGSVSSSVDILASVIRDWLLVQRRMSSMLLTCFQSVKQIDCSNLLTIHTYSYQASTRPPVKMNWRM
jgi:Reverse transcriptase (RNA-dependent DNA polymerase)